MTRNRLLMVAAIVGLILIAIFLFKPFSESSTEPVQPAVDEGDEADHGSGNIVSISSAQMQKAGIELVKISPGSAVELIFPATVSATPTGSARIDARAGGVVRRLTKTLGDPVARGETLAMIESAEAASLASQRATAQARVTELQSAYAREKQLFDANVTAKQDLEAAQANLSVARSELSRASAAVAAAGVSSNGRSLAVTSPLAGRITAAPAILGSYVMAGEELFRVVDPNRLQIEVAVASADAGRISPGDRAVVVLPDGEEVPARVRSITPSVDTESRSAVAVLSLTQAASGLQPGGFVQTRIFPEGETASNGFSVPEDAVQQIGGKDVVFVRQQGAFRAQPVRIGARSGGRVAILSGLNGNETIAGKNAFLIKAELGKAGAAHDE